MPEIIAFSIIVIVLVGTVVIWRRDKQRARDARIEPIQRESIATPSELRRRIADYCDDHAGLEAREADQHCFVTCTLPDEHRSPEPPPLRTYALELLLADDATAYVRYGQGEVEWTQGEDGLSRDPVVRWEWDRTPDFGHLGPDWEDVPEPTDKPIESVDGIVMPIRRIVREAGYAWQPTLEMKNDLAAHG